MDAFGSVNMHTNEPYRHICFHPSLEISFNFRYLNGVLLLLLLDGEGGETRGGGEGGCTLQTSTRTMLKQRTNSKETSHGKSDDRRLAIRLLEWKRKSGSFSFIEFATKSMQNMDLPAT